MATSQILPSLNFQNIPAQNEVPDVFGRFLNSYRQRGIDAQDRKTKMLQNMLMEKKINNSGLEGLTGPAMEALSYQRLKNSGNVNPETISWAERLRDTRLKNDESLIKSRDALTESMSFRNSSTLGKTILEQKDVEDGFVPGTNRTQRLTPAQQQQLSGQYGNKRLKETTDAGDRERAGYAGNLDGIRKSINIPSLTRFSGPEGAANLAKARAQSAKGVPSKELEDYEKQITRVQAFAKEYRRLNKDSVTDSNQKNLAYLVNPTNWYTHPDVAAAKLEAFFEISDRESENVKEKLKGPSQITGGDPFSKALKQNSSKSDFSNLSISDMDEKIAQLRAELQGGR